MPLSAKIDKVAISTEHWSIVNSQNAVSAETEESCPAVVSMRSEHHLSIFIVVEQYSGRSVLDAVSRKELLQCAV